MDEEEKLESSEINTWEESLEASLSSFFGVLSDVIHVYILVRFLTQSQVGIFFLSYAFLYLFAQIPRGIGIAVRKRASEINKGKSKYLYIGFIIIIPALLGIFAIFATGRPILNAYSSVQIPSEITIPLFLASTGFATLEFSRYYMAGCSDPGLAEKLRTSIAKTSMPIMTVGFLHLNASVEYALYAVFVSYFSTSLIIFALSPHQFVKPLKKDIIDILQYAKWSLTTSILNDFYRRWDTIILGIMVGSASLSYYDSSLRIAFLATTFAIGISKTSNVKMSGLIEIDEEIDDIAKKTVVACTFLIFPLLIVTIFSGEYLLRVLFGDEYTGARLFLTIMVVVQLFQSYRVQFESIFNSSDNPEITTRASLISVFINVLTAPILVIYLGGLGVLYSTILSEFARMIVYQLRVRSLLGNFIAPRGAFTQFISFSASCLIVFLLSKLLGISNLPLFMISLFVGSGVFFLSQYILSSETRTIVREYQK